MSNIPPKLSDKVSKDNIVWFDCEMTGLDLESDTLLEVAVIVTDADLNTLSEGPNLIIHQPDDVLDKMGEWCTRQHQQSGLTDSVKKSKLGMADCENQLLNYLQKWVPPGKCPIAGNSIGQDAKFLTKYMPRLMNHLHYRVIDVSTIKELTQRWYPDVMKNVPAKKLTHRALDDIRESIAELKYYRENCFK